LPAIGEKLRRGRLHGASRLAIGSPRRNPRIARSVPRRQGASRFERAHRRSNCPAP
jgi:hypothetical protein